MDPAVWVYPPSRAPHRRAHSVTSRHSRGIPGRNVGSPGQLMICSQKRSWLLQNSVNSSNELASVPLIGQKTYLSTLRARFNLWTTGLPSQIRVLQQPRVDARTTPSSFSMGFPGRDLGCCQRGVRSDEGRRCLFSRATPTPCAVERRPFWGESPLSPGGC